MLSGHWASRRALRRARALMVRTGLNPHGSLPGQVGPFGVRRKRPVPVDDGQLEGLVGKDTAEDARAAMDMVAGGDPYAVPLTQRGWLATVGNDHSVPYG